MLTYGQEHCTGELQRLMGARKVEYAVISTELEDSAKEHGDELAEAARQCRFRQQAFLVFGARGCQADDVTPECSPIARRGSTTLGHVARWGVALFPSGWVPSTQVVPW